VHIKTRLEDMIRYNLGNTKDLLTSRAGLICIGEIMREIGFTAAVDKHFPTTGSNRGFKASAFVNSMMLMLHEGGRCLEDLNYIKEDRGLRLLFDMNKVPGSDALGDWLRRTGCVGVAAVTEVNKVVLQTALHKLQAVTLDIDATFCVSRNREARWSYKKEKGYMPMVGHIAETGQVVATDFRDGNVAPASNNLEFIRQCEAALPIGVGIKAVRIDAAGYQAAIIDECIERNWQFAIRVKMSQGLKQEILSRTDAYGYSDCGEWQPLRDREGAIIEGESTMRLVHSMDNSKNAFDIVVQRLLVKGQQELDISTETGQEILRNGQYIYRAIAVSQHELSDSAWVHWYNQRGEHSENRIKELKSDFAGDRMPCKDFTANALYFALCALAYNLFALLRMFLPSKFESSRAKTVRLRIYALAGKIVRHGRNVCLKLQKSSRTLLEELISSILSLSRAH
jgi:hypothetical protein